MSVCVFLSGCRLRLSDFLYYAGAAASFAGLAASIIVMSVLADLRESALRLKGHVFILNEERELMLKNKPGEETLTCRGHTAASHR